MISGAAASDLSPMALPDREGLVVLKDGAFVYVRSAFSETKDVVIPVTVGPSNGQIIFGFTFLVPADVPMDLAEMAKHRWSFHPAFDDATPWCLNGTYIGANHGANDRLQVTSPGHALSEADLGSLWRDGDGVAFYLLGFSDPDTLLLLSENTGEYPRWKFTHSLAGKTLSNPKTGRSLPVEDFKLSQLVPACRINTQSYLVDGKEPLAEGVPTPCRSFEVFDAYDIIAPDAVLEAVKKSPGEHPDYVSEEREAVLSNEILYRFQPQGACEIRHRAKALRDFDLGYMGFIQSSPLQAEAGDELKSYIPKTLPFRADGVDYDFGNWQNLSEPPKGPLIFSAEKGNIADPDDLPDRFVQILQDGEHRAGFAMGYSRRQGLTEPTRRAASTQSPLFIHTTRKTYPAAIDKKGGPIKAGTEFEAFCYRQYFDPDSHPDASCVYGHFENGDYILFGDFQQAVEKTWLELPRFLEGKRFEVLEKSDALTILSKGLVEPDGVALSVSGAGGRVVLRVPAEP